MLSRRRFLELLTGATGVAATNPKFFFAPQGGWHDRSGYVVLQPQYAEPYNALGRLTPIGHVIAASVKQGDRLVTLSTGSLVYLTPWKQALLPKLGQPVAFNPQGELVAVDHRYGRSLDSR